MNWMPLECGRFDLFTDMGAITTANDTPDTIEYTRIRIINILVSVSNQQENKN